MAVDDPRKEGSEGREQSHPLLYLHNLLSAVSKLKINNNSVLRMITNKDSSRVHVQNPKFIEKLNQN